MSIKDGVKYVQKELSGDEKILESALKIETLYKKYRYTIWGVVIVALIFVIANSIIVALKENRLTKANEAFLILQNDPENKDALQSLKENNPNLYSLMVLRDKDKINSIESSNHWLIQDVVSYTKATQNEEIVQTSLFGELSQLISAKEALVGGDLDKVSLALEGIDNFSPAFSITQIYKHFIIKGK